MKKPQIIFEPGCFDDFEGTQEELDAMVAEINRMVESGEFFDNAMPFDDYDLLDDVMEQPKRQTLQ